jgi:hypothetical protein
LEEWKLRVVKTTQQNFQHLNIDQKNIPVAIKIKKQKLFKKKRKDLAYTLPMSCSYPASIIRAASRLAANFW